jgi:iron(II)-dependent oxidoreductase
MALVPPGCLMMGSSDGADDEKPVNRQCFDKPFWIDRTEVTQAQFRRFNGKAGRESKWTGDNRPRDSVTWFEARDFCAQRGARLPTEAEWEYAARGPDGLEYPWGNSWDSNNAVYSGNSGGQTADAGSRPGGVSWVGALDMSGNVWQWMSSSYKAYPYDPKDGRESSELARNDQGRVLRGGSWLSTNTDHLRAAHRIRLNPSYAYDVVDVGFRCARSS